MLLWAVPENIISILPPPPPPHTTGGISWGLGLLGPRDCREKKKIFNFFFKSFGFKNPKPPKNPNPLFGGGGGGGEYGYYIFWNCPK